MTSLVRRFLGFVVLALAGLALLVFVAAPALVRPMVVTAVRSALPFGDQRLQVDADVTGPGLIGGSIDSIRVQGADLTPNGYDGVSIGKLDVTLRDVAIGSHAFTSVSGGLDDVVFPVLSGGDLTVARIELTGASNAVTGAAQLQPAESVALVTELFADSGVTVSGVELADGTVNLTVYGQQVELAIDVEDGALVVPDAFGAGPITLLEPGPDDRWRLTGASVAPGGIELDVVMDANALLSGG